MRLILDACRASSLWNALLLILAFAGCSGNGNQKNVERLGHIDPRLNEASGLVASINNPGYFWSINDGDNPAEVFLIDEHASIRLVCTLDSVENRDWEDVGIQTEKDGTNYVYVADIGDNNGKYDFKMIYRFQEPMLSDQHEIRITNFDTLFLKLPGKPRDTETLLIDPITHDLYLVSKREEAVRLYRAAYPFAKDTLIMEKTLVLPFRHIVAGNISADGQNILLKDYVRIYYWKRDPAESVTQALSKDPIELPYQREPQGEAITWSRDGEYYYTLSESLPGKQAEFLKYRFENNE